MMTVSDALKSFLDLAPSLVLVEINEALGSTPRERGTWMLVSKDRIFGTIGGGQLEYMAIDEARRALALTPGNGTSARDRLSIPLGPEIGQCCGGRVDLSLRMVDARLLADLVQRAAWEDALKPHVYIFGGGHVGHALAGASSLLPVQVIVVETRAAELEGLPEDVETRLTPMPEEVVRDAPAGSAFVVLTHDHALDFLIVAEALKRDDAAYVGMIGSKTKKATFRSWYLRTAGGTDDLFGRLVSPIGGETVKDKRPPVIAALAAAEIMTALARFALGRGAAAKPPYKRNEKAERKAR